MHNWYEMYVFGREKAADLLRQSEEIRLVGRARKSFRKSTCRERVLNRDDVEAEYRGL